MSLAEIISEIKKIKPFAEEDVDSGPAETLVGRRGRKNQALVRMADLKRAYREELLKSALFIIVSGPTKDEFAEVAAKSKCLVTDPETFYNDLSNRLAPAVLSGRQTMDNAFDVLGRHLEDKAIELGLSGYPQVVFKQQYGRTIKSKEDLTAVIKQAINDQMGAEIVGIQAAASLVSTAVDQGYKEKFGAIVLPTDDEKLIAALMKDLKRLSPRVFKVVTGSVAVEETENEFYPQDVSQKSVRSILTKIRSTLK
jgi:hypothetical protein